MGKPVGTPDVHKTQYELERDARIKANKERMAQLGLAQAALDFSQALNRDQDSKAAPRKKQKPRAHRPRCAEPAEPRRSSRVQNLPPVKYMDIVEREERPVAERRSRTKKAVRVFGLRAVIDVTKDPVGAWQAAPAGWKLELGTPSREAGLAAISAAKAYADKLGAQGRRGFVKEMTRSQVASGFWCSQPPELGPYYGVTGGKRPITMICWNQAARHPDSFLNVVPGTTAAWRVVHLPRESDSGWSGGWRGFAIDNMLGPVDAVVFEVLDNAEGEAEMKKASELAAAAAAAATAAAAGKQDKQQQQEAEQQQEQGASGSNSTGSGEGPSSSGGSCDGGSAGSGEEGQSPGGGSEQQEEVQGCGAGSSGKGKATQKEVDWAPEVYTDAPAVRRFVRAHIFRATDYETEEAKQQRQAEAAAATAAAAAAAAEDAAAEAEDAAEDAAEAAEAAADAVAKVAPAGARQRKGSRKRGSTESAAAGAAGAGAAAPKQKRQKRAGGAAAVVDAGAGASKKRSRKQEQQQQEEEAEQAGSSRKRSKRAAGKAAAAAPALVPQPVNSRVLVPPPTDDELRRNTTAESFAVECIIAHKVVKGEDQFLVRWEGYGPYWDEWVGAGCLDAPPHTYSWQGGKGAVPAKFRPAAGGRR